LGREIIDFAAHASLTDEEASARRDVVAALNTVVKHTLGDVASCEIFGSFSFNLSLFCSDVDVALRCDSRDVDDTAALARVSEALAKSSADTFSVDSLLHTRVPLLKITHIPTGIQVDMSMATATTTASVNAQREFMQTSPEARPVILCLKALLRQWGLASVFSGGLSSTAVYLLVERYAKLTASSRRMASHLSSPSCSTPRSDGDWRSTAPPSEDDFYHAFTATVADFFLGFLQHACSDAFAFGFGLFDRHDPTNEVSRRTKRTVQIQAFMMHTRNSLQMLLEAGASHAGGPPTLLSAVAADPRCMVPTVYNGRGDGVSVRVGAARIA
jgi:predicted nucleotidyltransferase